jgi:hypothetical protein
MAEETEYIFKKDFWGNWKLVPQKKDNGSVILVFLAILLLILLLALITLPLWAALLGFTMVKRKRYYAGLFSIIALIYFVLDVKYRWFTSFLFFGYRDNNGYLNEGIFSEKYITYVYYINGIGVLLGVYFIFEYFFKYKYTDSRNTSSDASSLSIIDEPADKDSNKNKIILFLLGAIITVFIAYYYLNRYDFVSKTESQVFSQLSIGASYKGGVVIQLDESGNHGLIISEEDLGDGNWYRATELCENYSNDGYEDWRLPSIHELRTIYSNKNVINNFQENWYWSNTEDPESVERAMHLGFIYGDETFVPKEHGKFIRAVRKF